MGRQERRPEACGKRKMNFQDWEKIELNSLEILELEQEADRLQNHEDPEHVARVCVGLLKQTRYQSKLLENAMNRIGFLEMERDILLGKQKPHL